MREVYDVCIRNAVTIPPEVVEFFGDEPPSDLGMIQGIDEALETSRWGEVIIDLEKLPKQIKKIRVVVE
jgi:hypothetical protein